MRSRLPIHSLFSANPVCMLLCSGVFVIDSQPLTGLQYPKPCPPCPSRQRSKYPCTLPLHHPACQIHIGNKWSNCYLISFTLLSIIRYCQLRIHCQFINANLHLLTHKSFQLLFPDICHSITNRGSYYVGYCDEVVKVVHRKLLEN